MRNRLAWFAEFKNTLYILLGGFPRIDKDFFLVDTQGCECFLRSESRAGKTLMRQLPTVFKVLYTEG